MQQYFEQVNRPTNKYDSYLTVYEHLFAPYKGKDIVFVEIGILGGGSLEVWKKYFGPGSRIIGVDIYDDLKASLEKDGFEIHIGDQASPQFWQNFYKEVGNIDILLDDGGHTNEDQKTTLRESIDHVNDGGLIIIEDTHTSYLKRFGNPSKDSFIAFAKQLMDEITYRSCKILEEYKENKYNRSIYGIYIFESIVAFHINKKLAKRSKPANFGDNSKKAPRQFRHEIKGNKRTFFQKLYNFIFQ